MAYLTSLARAKDWMGVTDDSQDSQILSNSFRATAQIKKWLEYDPTSQTYSETRDGNSSRLLGTRAIPISAVSGVTVDGVAIQQWSSPTGAGWYNDDKFIYLSGYKFHRGFANVVLSYTAGYTPPFPDDLELGCLIAVQALMSAPGIDPNIINETMPGVVTTTYKTDSVGSLTPNAKSILQPYRRTWMLG